MNKAISKAQGATRTYSEQRSVGKPFSKHLRTPLKIFHGLALGGVLVLLVLIADRLLDSLDQPITRVEIVGELTHIDRTEIAQWVQSRITEGVLTTDLHSLQMQLQERPWVASVAVRRKWPGILAVSLRERVAVARWNEKALLTDEGKIFEPQQLPLIDDLPHLWGVAGGAKEVLQQFHWIQAQFKAMGLQVVAVSRAQRGAWHIELVAMPVEGNENEAAIFQMALGKQDMVGRLARFKTLYDGVLKTRINDIKRVDLRYTNGVAVQWKAENESVGV